MTWGRGRADVERSNADGRLERVAASAVVAARLVADARAHIRLATKGTEQPEPEAQAAHGDEECAGDPTELAHGTGPHHGQHQNTV